MTGRQTAVEGSNPATPQPGLRISHPDDRWEREADRTADRVLQAPARPTGLPVTVDLTGTRGWSGIQRCPGGCPGEEETDTMMRSAVDGAAAPATAATPGHAPAAGVVPSQAPVRGAGAARPLPPDVRSYFEPRFGHDFSRVRVHDSAAASAAAAGISARAYTRGRDVVFAAGAFRPDSAGGRRLLAHELAHVVQQGEAERLEASS